MTLSTEVVVELETLRRRMQAIEAADVIENRDVAVIATALEIIITHIELLRQRIHTIEGSLSNGR